MEPAVLENLGGFLWYLPVSLHDLGTTNKQFTYFVRRQRFACFDINDASLRARQGDADTTNATFSLERVGVGTGRSFGQTITFDEVALREFFKGFLYFDR